MLDLRKTEGVLQTERDFPWCYTKFEIERRPKKGDALQTGGARIAARVWYVHTRFFPCDEVRNLGLTWNIITLAATTLQSEHNTCTVKPVWNATHDVKKN